MIKNPLTVNPYLKYAMSHTDFCMMLGDAINAIFAGESHALRWVSHPSYNGEVFSMFCRDSVWYLELGPEARPTHKWKPWKPGQSVREAVGSQG